jgi:hypothetical protein
MIVTLPSGKTINTRDVRLIEDVVEGTSITYFYITVADLNDRIMVSTHDWREGPGMANGRYIETGIPKEKVIESHADLLKKWDAS